MLVNAAALDALRTTFRLDFNEGMKRFEPQWAKIATLVPSSSKNNTYGWLKDFPRLREWIGDRVVKSITEGSYVIQNRSFEDTVSVGKDDISDDELGVYKPMMMGLGQAAAEFPDELVFALLAAGFSTRCWDGQYFFDTDHPIGETGATYSNVQVGAGPAWYLMDTTRPLKPLIYQERQKPNFVSMTEPTDEAVFMRKDYRFGVDLRANAGFGFPQMAFASTAELNAANYAALRQAMTSQVGDTGGRINIRPNLVVVPPALRAAAKQLFGAELLPGGGNNIYFKDADVLEAPWLA